MLRLGRRYLPDWAVAYTNPVKYIMTFLCTVPLQYVSKRLFTLSTIDCLTTNKHNNGCHDETFILSCIGVEAISHSLSKYFLETCCKSTVTKNGINIMSGR